MEKNNIIKKKTGVNIKHKSIRKNPSVEMGKVSNSPLSSFASNPFLPSYVKEIKSSIGKSRENREKSQRLVKEKILNLKKVSPAPFLQKQGTSFGSNLNNKFDKTKNSLFFKGKSFKNKVWFLEDTQFKQFSLSNYSVLYSPEGKNIVSVPSGDKEEQKKLYTSKAVKSSSNQKLQELKRFVINLKNPLTLNNQNLPPSFQFPIDSASHEKKEKLKILAPSLPCEAGLGGKYISKIGKEAGSLPGAKQEGWSAGCEGLRKPSSEKYQPCKSRDFYPFYNPSASVFDVREEEKILSSDLRKNAPLHPKKVRSTSFGQVYLKKFVSDIGGKDFEKLFTNKKIQNLINRKYQIFADSYKIGFSERKKSEISFINIKQLPNFLTEENFLPSSCPSFGRREALPSEERDLSFDLASIQSFIFLTKYKKKNLSVASFKRHENFKNFSYYLTMPPMTSVYNKKVRKMVSVPTKVGTKQKSKSLSCLPSSEGWTRAEHFSCGACLYLWNLHNKVINTYTPEEDTLFKSKGNMLIPHAVLRTVGVSKKKSFSFQISDLLPVQNVRIKNLRTKKNDIMSCRASEGGSKEATEKFNFKILNQKLPALPGMKKIDFLTIQTLLTTQFLEKAINNIKPNLEVRKVRRGGTTYQVPTILRRKRSEKLAIQWLIESAQKNKKKSSFSESLANELMQAFYKSGEARQKRNILLQLAESNRAYIRYRWW